MRHIRKNFNVFFDGRGYAGEAEEFTPPKLAIKADEFQGGGMAAPVDITMGHEKLEAEFTLISVDRHAIGAFNIVEGREVGVTLREALESADGTVTAVTHNMRGKVKEVDQGSVKAGEKGALKVALSLTYYRLTHGGAVVQEIDVPNMICKQNGVDLLAPFRAALGR